jgi:DNA polymerase-1
MTLLLVDGTNVVMRYVGAMVTDAQHASDAEIEKVLRGVTKAIVDCADVAGATHLIVALDSGVGSWRRDKYPEYKAKRTDSTLIWSNRLNIHLAARAVVCVRAPSFEADDVIATLSARAERAGKMVAILSGDSDLLQLASLSVYCYQFGKPGVEARFVNRPMQWIREHYEIPSAGQLAAYKALVGEPGDGLPGVPGIGPVKAKKLLHQYESTVALCDSMAIDTPAFLAALELVTLREDVPIDPIPPALCRINPRRMVAP